MQATLARRKQLCHIRPAPSDLRQAPLCSPGEKASTGGGAADSDLASLARESVQASEVAHGFNMRQHRSSRFALERTLAGMSSL
mmetsp:Transcript_29409/g.94276  ORF Transcript_29409/g.94276 Transcript_29409/m.94276 type:complete len:84 (-) Transcript_29409:102-353(-)